MLADGADQTSRYVIAKLTPRGKPAKTVSTPPSALTKNREIKPLLKLIVRRSNFSQLPKDARYTPPEIRCQTGNYGAAVSVVDIREIFAYDA